MQNAETDADTAIDAEFDHRGRGRDPTPKPTPSSTSEVEVVVVGVDGFVIVGGIVDVDEIVALSRTTSWAWNGRI